jgi:hypothetical protein
MNVPISRVFTVLQTSGSLMGIVFLLFANSASTFAVETSPIQWSFDSEAAMPMELRGEVIRDQAGPRPPTFPQFAAENTALRFDGAGFLTMNDPGTESVFDFTLGDTITLEAWVRIDKAPNGQQMYVVSKGRTGSAKYTTDNQNWALRVVAQEGIVRASFLFATPIERTKSDAHWHRWITDDGFAPGSEWHHIAVAYTFGDHKSIRSWIDGTPSDGKWDMGGPTDLAPVVDDDDVWIGSSRGGSSANSFRGWMDNVSIDRRMPTDEEMARRYDRVGGRQRVSNQPAIMPELGAIAEGSVQVSIAENFPSHVRWLLSNESEPESLLTFENDSFLLPRVPARFDDWGIRDAWKAPLLVRMAADVEIPAGNHRVLTRVRSLSRLWIDGELVSSTKAARSRGGNLVPIDPVPPPPVPGAKHLPFAQQETFVDLNLDANEQHNRRRVVLEWIVGGGNLRTESGEVVVAIQIASTGELLVLRPESNSPLPLTEVAIDAASKQIEQTLIAIEDVQRRTARQSRNAYWQSRHKAASDYVVQQTAATDKPTRRSIDEFITDKIREARSDSQQHDAQTTEFFHGEVLPLLRTQCFRCHGEKESGGLRLNSRDAVLASGESELPAVVPGDLDNSELITQVRDRAMPPTEDGLNNAQIEILERWVSLGAPWPTQPLTPEQTTLAPVIDDAAFLRRVSLDTIGVGPTADEVREFLADTDPNKRKRAIDRLLADNRFADHWVSMFMDLLAENPTLLNTSIGSTGPFRWFLHDALKDNVPYDRMVTELLLMRGDDAHGGSAGFAIAGENDAPMAAKAHIASSAFLGIELQCARCHDSPYHSTTQEDLYSLAAMLGRKPLAPPKSSRVPDAFFKNIGRESLIKVTLKPGVAVTPQWPFASTTGAADGPAIEKLLSSVDDTRERLAALITSPQNARFPRVIINHLWNRLIGAAFVQPVEDWEGRTPSHPELLAQLANDFVASGYDLKSIIRQIMSSQLYARQAIGKNRVAAADQRFFTAPDPRRLSAEQIVDSLLHASGRDMDVEEITFVHDGSLPMSNRLSLGRPQRAWEFAGLNNERDRPSLSMPRAQSVVDVLQAFGWTGTRQQPIATRETDPNVLQPGILANGTFTMSLTRAAAGAPLAELALAAATPTELVDELFLRLLGHYPSAEQRSAFVADLQIGFDDRRTPEAEVQWPEPDPPLPQSTWTNHLLPEANEIQVQWQERVQRGPPADPRLMPAWREVYEDMVWSLVNHREFVWMP